MFETNSNVAIQWKSMGQNFSTTIEKNLIISHRCLLGVVTATGDILGLEESYSLTDSEVDLDSFFPPFFLLI